MSINLYPEPTEVNFKAFDVMLHYAKHHGVNMQAWFNSSAFPFLGSKCSDIVLTEDCGTVGCLLGTYYLATGNREEILPKHFGFSDPQEALKNFIEEFGVSILELRWLFLMLYRPDYRDGCSSTYKSLAFKYSQHSLDISSEEAISRLERFIEYKKRKALAFHAWNSRLHRKGLECRLPPKAKTLEETFPLLQDQVDDN